MKAAREFLSTSRGCSLRGGPEEEESRQPGGKAVWRAGDGLGAEAVLC